MYSGLMLPKLRPWAEKNIGIDANKPTPAQKDMPVDSPYIN